MASSTMTSSTQAIPPIRSHLPVNVGGDPFASERSRVANPDSMITMMNSICTMNPHTLSITPTATAPADDRPTFVKKRISSAMRAAELGTARATN